jgi:hypothetical protein
MANRAQNERKFVSWTELPDGGRRYWIDVTGRLGWFARYVKEVDASEATVRFWQEIYDVRGHSWKFMKSFLSIKAIERYKIES